jgi:hypothetical protein
MRISKAAKCGLLALASLSIAGCASLEGAPKAIIPVSKSLDILKDHDVQNAILKFHGAAGDRHNLDQRQYRDMVIALYLNAIDARYNEFRKDISGEGRGGAIGADAAVVGLTTMATLVEKSATDLSAVAAAFAGGKGTVDKNLYFDRALPAILAAMDAERAKVRKHIVASMRNSEKDYPLEVAFGDLAAYEASASIDRAIDSITAAAAAGRAIETVALENVVQACATPVDLAAENARVFKVVTSLSTGPSPNVDALKKLASFIGADSKSAKADELEDAIADRLISYPCSKEGMDNLIAKIKIEPWGGAI